MEATLLRQKILIEIEATKLSTLKTNLLLCICDFPRGEQKTHRISIKSSYVCGSSISN